MTILPWPEEDPYRRRRKPMPTVAGDIVISHPTAATSHYSVWRVMLDGEQSANPLAYASSALGGSAAMMLARLMRRETRGVGAIYFIELDTLTWTKLSD